MQNIYTRFPLIFFFASCVSGVLCSTGHETTTKSLNEPVVVPKGEAAWHMLEHNISNHDGWKINDCVKLFQGDSDEFLSKKLIEEINKDIAAHSATGNLLGDEGIRYAKVAATFASHKPHIREYLVNLAIGSDVLRDKFQKNPSKFPIGRTLSSTIFGSVGNNMHPDAYDTLNDLWDVLDHHDENKILYYESLCKRIDNNVNKDEAILVLESLLNDENNINPDILRALNTIDVFRAAKNILEKNRSNIDRQTFGNNQIRSNVQVARAKYMSEIDSANVDNKTRNLFAWYFMALAFLIFIFSLIFTKYAKSGK